jgi:nucleoside-diphosphate-sugar epimerase
MFVTHAKAGLELGFVPCPVDDALTSAVDWFRANGYAS